MQFDNLQKRNGKLDALLSSKDLLTKPASRYTSKRHMAAYPRFVEYKQDPAKFEALSAQTKADKCPNGLRFDGDKAPPTTRTPIAPGQTTPSRFTGPTRRTLPPTRRPPSNASTA
jgi:hypothetical protein